MDTERLAEFVSTLLIIAGVAFVVFIHYGVEPLAARVFYTVSVTAVPFVPLVWYLVYYREEETYMFGPWGPEDLLFLAVVTPLLFGIVRVADTYLADSALYWVVVFVGLFVAIAVAVVARSLAIGEWPPGSELRGGDEEAGP